MSMKTWAEKEIEIVCAKERERNGEDSTYGIACCESALKAFNSLMEDGHSGCSISMTKFILNRLIDGKPLTPIEDTDDVWNEIQGDSIKTTYQCNRMSSLFKDVYADGTVKYKDINGSHCIDINSIARAPYHNAFIQNIVDEVLPITMPYYPGKPVEIYCAEFLSDFKNGDFDTIGVLFAKPNDGERVEIRRYFKESANGWEEITKPEYEERKRLAAIKCQLSD